MRIHRILTIVLVVFSLAAQPCLSMAGNAEAEIKSVLDAHAAALSAKDISAMMVLFASEPAPVMLGTVSEEHWIGTNAIRAAYQSFFDDFDSGTVQYTWVNIGVNGNMAWFAATCQVESTLSGEKDTFPVNWTGVLKKEEGKWLLVTSHFSMPGPEEASQ